MADHRECQLLELLPAEIRNNIYELTFTTDEGQVAGSVDILQARSPSVALLASCGQIHREAKGFYREAYHQYWSETHFVLNLDAVDPRHRPTIPKALTGANLRRIRHISVNGMPATFDILSTIRKNCVPLLRLFPRRTRPLCLVRRADRYWCFDDSEGTKLSQDFVARFILRIDFTRRGYLTSVPAGRYAQPPTFGTVTREEIATLLGIEMGA